MTPGFKLSDIESRCKDPRELLRGRDLVKGKYVVIDVDDHTGVSASVRSSGKEQYVVLLKHDLAGECACVSFALSKERKFCKHLAAVALMVLDVTTVTVTYSADDEIQLLVNGLSPQQCADLLIEAAVMSPDVRRRLTEGAWVSASL